MYRASAALVLGGLVLAAPPALASQAEAREAARQANCKPGKIETLKTTTGRTGETIYKIECQGQKDVAVIVRCIGRLCTVTR